MILHNITIFYILYIVFLLYSIDYLLYFFTFYFKLDSTGDIGYNTCLLH
jgi:hypothetical protein